MFDPPPAAYASEPRIDILRLSPHSLVRLSPHGGSLLFHIAVAPEKQRHRWRMHRVLAAIERRPNYRRRGERDDGRLDRGEREALGPAHGRGRASAHKAVRSASDSWTEHLARAVADEILIGQRDVAIDVVDRDLGGDAREPRAGPNVPQHPRSLVAPCVVLDSDTSRRDE
jgi:hypothetical protein